MKQSIMRTLSAAVFSLALIQAAPLYADHKLSHQKGCCIIKQIEKIKDKLDLSPEQESSLKIIEAKSKVFMKKRHKELKNIYEEANKLAKENAIDKRKLDMLADKRANLARQTIKHHVFLKHEIYHILNEKQRQKLNEDMQDRKNHKH